MNLKAKSLCIVKICTLIFFSSAAYSHEGHQHEDIVLEDLGDLGTVNFPVSCSRETQKAFNTGVGLLHHMMYAQAELLFKKWMQEKPKCAILYWGYSMSLFHPLWPDNITEDALTRGRRALTNAKNLKGSEREKSYLSAAEQYYKDWQTVPEKTRLKAWVKAQTDVYYSYPSDIDATAFYALSQLATASKTDKTFSTNKNVGQVLEAIIKEHPRHPGAIHYSIHAYDNPVLAQLGLESAKAYDKIAPDVPHALHMPTHIFVRLGEWRDVVSWNVRSAEAALKYPTNGMTSMHYSHALDYLVYGHLQLGEGDKASKALRLLESHHPIQDTFPAAYALSTMPARIYLEQKEWHLASQLKTRNPSYISWDKFPEAEAITYFARGIGAARNGDLEAARENIKMLDQLYLKTKYTSPNYWALLVGAQRKSVKAWIYFAEGKKQKALDLLSEAADIEDSLDKNPVTPGAVLPARDLLGDMLLLTGDNSSARQAYNASLKIGPKRRYSLLGSKKAENIN